MAMTQEQDPISCFQSECQAAQIVVVDRSTLTSYITIMPMAEVLIAPPQTMWLQGGVLNAITKQPEHIGFAVVEANHQPAALITTRCLG